jgi:L-ascorbate metabolism protein UlaG (beta-lactamase superfamily)
MENDHCSGDRNAKPVQRYRAKSSLRTLRARTNEMSGREAARVRPKTLIFFKSGIPAVEELDWWQSAGLSSDLTVTLVPAQHFSSRTLWDRNRALWGGFVLSGPSGNVYFSGDTGYGPHFREIARRFKPIKVALLPIAPFRLKSSNPAVHRCHHLPLHMGPGEAVQAHLDLGAKVSMVAHFQVFQLGADKFDDAVEGLARALKEGNLKPDTFLVLNPGQGKDWPTP